MNQHRIKRRILLVEDEPTLVLTLTDRLISDGYEVEHAGDGETAVELVKTRSYDLILLDVMLPGKNGFDVCRDLRTMKYQTPIMMLTARQQVVDKVVGLKLGADDYLTKPFDMAELAARLEALLRRTQGASGSEADSYAFGRIRVDFKRREVLRDGEVVALSALDYKLLCYFIEHRGETLERNRLLDDVWGYDASLITRTVDVHVLTLRQRIEDNPNHPVWIVTAHRVGYKFTG